MGSQTRGCCGQPRALSCPSADHSKIMAWLVVILKQMRSLRLAACQHEAHVRRRIQKSSLICCLAPPVLPTKPHCASATWEIATPSSSLSRYRTPHCFHIEISSCLFDCMKPLHPICRVSRREDDSSFAPLRRAALGSLGPLLRTLRTLRTLRQDRIGGLNRRVST